MVNSGTKIWAITSGAPASAPVVAASSVDLDVARLAGCHHLRRREGNAQLPSEFLEGSRRRPLQWIHDGQKKWKHWWKPLWNACETSKPLYETSIQSMFDEKNMAFNGCIISIWHFWAFSPVVTRTFVVQDWLGRDFCWRISSTKGGQNGANENVSNCKYRLTKLSVVLIFGWY